MQGYPVCRVLTVAPGPTVGEAANPQVGPTYVRESPPSMQKMSTTGPMGGGAGGLGAPTINTKNIDGGLPGRRAGGPGTPTINTKNIDGGPLGRQCRMSGSTQHLHKNHR
jgi:hypothetical protein